MVPSEAIGVIATRIQDSEASVGEKVFLFELIGNAATNLVKVNQTTDGAEEEQKQSAQQKKYRQRKEQDAEEADQQEEAEREQMTSARRSKPTSNKRIIILDQRGMRGWLATASQFSM